jgi:hypothetical protein
MIAILYVSAHFMPLTITKNLAKMMLLPAHATSARHFSFQPAFSLEAKFGD